MVVKALKNGMMGQMQIMEKLVGCILAKIHVVPTLNAQVSVPEYQMTMAVWARGLLSDEFSVNTDQIIYRTGGTNEFGRKERLPLELPDHLDVKTIGPGRSLNDLILKGDIDAIISPSPPLAFINNNSLVTRLFADPKVAEQDYFNRTGIFPIMHLIGIRREIALSLIHI